MRKDMVILSLGLSAMLCMSVLTKFSEAYMDDYEFMERYRGSADNLGAAKIPKTDFGQDMRFQMEAYPPSYGPRRYNIQISPVLQKKGLLANLWRGLTSIDQKLQRIFW